MAGPITLEQLVTFLLDTPMFGGLSTAELSEIVTIMQVQHLREGQLLFEEGQAGNAWYVVYEGQLEILKDAGQGAEVLATRGPKACIGEMAVLDGSARSATARAAGQVTLFKFPRTAFAELLQAENHAAYKLVHQMALVLVARQRDITSRLSSLLHANQDALVREGLAPIVELASPSE